VANAVKEKNIQIPISLFNSIIEFMDSLDISKFDTILLIMYKGVQYGLRRKRISMIHRETFAAVVNADDEKKRLASLDNYVNTKLYYEKYDTPSL
jgi:hypothetical protein